LFNEFHGADSSLWGRVSRNSPPFMKFEGPLQSLEDPATGPHPEVCIHLQQAGFIAAMIRQPFP
jgi:hypothetical protein